MLVALSVLSRAAAGNARLTHETPKAGATRPAVSDALSLTHSGALWRYAIFGRRDELVADRNLLNAVVIASGGLRFGGHGLYLGLGTHFQRVQLSGQSGQSRFAPAAGFHWQSDRFNLEILGAEKLTRAQAALFIHFLIPVELMSLFEYLESQPYRWSVDIFASVSRLGGLIGGFEPIAPAARAGLWLKPLENLSLRALSRLPLTGEVYFEFSCAYAWNDIPAPGLSVRSEEALEPPAKVKPETRIPAFATLIKWGLTPVMALKLTREKNICALDRNSRAKLARHHWECRDAQ